jgi:hypothetical protein
VLDGIAVVPQVRITTGDNFWVVAAEREEAGRFIVHADEMRTAFLELASDGKSCVLHVLLSAQIKIGHATAWIRTRVCASFMLRPSLLLFGFAPWFARILREKLTALWNWNRRFAQQNTHRSVESVKIKLANCRGSRKSLLDFVIRQFQLIFGTAE